MVPVEDHIPPRTSGPFGRLHKLAPPRTRPQTVQKAQWSSFNIRSIVPSHDRLDSLASFIGVIEGNSGDVVVKDVCFYDAVEKVAAYKAEVAVDGAGSTAGESPSFRTIMRKSRISVLEICNGDCEISLVPGVVI